MKLQILITILLIYLTQSIHLRLQNRNKAFELTETEEDISLADLSKEDLESLANPTQYSPYDMRHPDYFRNAKKKNNKDEAWDKEYEWEQYNTDKMYNDSANGVKEWYEKYEAGKDFHY